MSKQFGAGFLVSALLVPVALFYVHGWDGGRAASPRAPTSPMTTAPAADPVPQAVTAAGPPALPVTDVSPTLPVNDVSPTPPEPPKWTKAEPLAEAVTQAMSGFPGRYSVAVHDLVSGEQWILNGEEKYHPASTIKLPVALYALEQYRQGKLRWDDLITYTPADFESPGGGAFETAPFGGQYPVSNLVERALKHSNNVAVNMLGRHLGWENIRQWTRTIGGDLWREESGMPSVTVRAELGWWLHLERLSREDPESAELLLKPLREVPYRGRIAAGLPDGVPYLHKFGSYDGNFHDGGWVLGDHPFLLVVMTSGATEGEADAAIAKVTGAIYRVMTDVPASTRSTP
jgi:beta-lactamase class A